MRLFLVFMVVSMRMTRLSLKLLLEELQLLHLLLRQ
jgi:hypothetical protein